MAQAYHRVASADGDMRDAVRVLERVRTLFLAERDGLTIWRLLNQEIGSASPTGLQPTLIDLRSWFESQLLDQQRLRIQKVFSSNPETGWREWLRTFAEALAYWRVTVCSSLLDAGVPFPDEFNEPFDFKLFVRLIIHERWSELHRFFEALAARDFLSPRTRARLLISVGQIHLYYFPQSGDAQSFFKAAEAQDPNCGRVLAALGEFALQQSDYETARTYFERAQSIAPDEVDSYVFLGDLCERQGSVDEARKWYQEAIRK